jgi:hypothetical protein
VSAKEAKDILSIVAGVLFVIAFIPYIRAILRKETEFVKPAKPEKATWMIWVGLDYILLVGMIFKKTVNGQIIGAVIGGTIVVCLALKYGKSGWTKTDKFCLCGGVLGIILLIINPSYGIMASCVVAIIGSIPTCISAWQDPSREDRRAWTIFWSSCVCAVIAIPEWTLAHTLQPVTFFIIESSVTAILYVRPLLLGGKKAVC